MALNRQPDRALAAFAVHRGALALACGLLLPRQPLAAAALATGNAALALAFAGLARRPTPAEPPAWRLLLPWVLWLLCWLETGWLIDLAGRDPRDAAVAAADLALFGGPWHERLGRLLPGAGLAEAMQALYLSYYALVLGPPLLLALRGRRRACADYTATVTATYLLCYLAYVVHPVLGPRAAALAGGGGDGAAGGVAAGLAAALRAAGDSPGTAFPSSHCAGALAAALAAGAHLGPHSRALIVAWAALVAVATVHTGNHYTLDSAAGLLLAVGVRTIAARGPLPRLRPCQRRLT